MLEQGTLLYQLLVGCYFYHTKLLVPPSVVSFVASLKDRDLPVTSYEEARKRSRLVEAEVVGIDFGESCCGRIADTLADEIDVEADIDSGYVSSPHCAN